MKSYVDAMLRYFSFSGRTGRAQYWLFFLWYFILLIGAMLGDARLGGGTRHLGVLTLFVLIFHLVPSITTTVRRLHDIGRSGWWYLVVLLPFGSLVLLYWTCCAGQEGGNDHGDPDEWLKPSEPRDDPPPARAPAFSFGGGRRLTLAQIEASRGAGRRLVE